MLGKKVEWDSQILKPGEYSKTPDGVWYGCSPNGEMCNLAGHTIVEHEDGTITVSPSIGIGKNNERWHGYLEHGVWRSC